MSKRFKNKVGDVFEIPLENSENGYGRILIVEYPILFCEFYNITLSQKYSLEELKGMDTILSIWCSAPITLKPLSNRYFILFFKKEVKTWPRFSNRCQLYIFLTSHINQVLLVLWAKVQK